jgi:hypothetical protein
MKARILLGFSFITYIFSIRSIFAGTDPSAAQVKDQLSDILNNWEFRKYEQGDSLQELIIRVLSWLGLRSNNISQVDTSEWVINLVLLVIGLILIIYLLRHLAPFWRIMTPDAATKEAEAGIGVPLVPLSLFNKAEDLAHEQSFREALRYLYLALLLELDEKRIISYQNAKTNHQYFKEVNNKARHLRDNFGDMMNLFERKWYGLEECTNEDYRSGLNLYQAITKEGA